LKLEHWKMSARQRLQILMQRSLSPRHSFWPSLKVYQETIAVGALFQAAEL
jgi:hypothetical protein